MPGRRQHQDAPPAKGLLLPEARVPWFLYLSLRPGAGAAGVRWGRRLRREGLGREQGESDTQNEKTRGAGVEGGVTTEEGGELRSELAERPK